MNGTARPVVVHRPGWACQPSYRETDLTNVTETPGSLRRGSPCPLVQDDTACGKPVVGRSMCAMHYRRWKLYGDPLYEVRRYVPQGEKCAAPEGCDRKPKRRGMCEMHARRMLQRGTTIDPRERKFWAQIDQTGGPEACWPWIGYIHPTGYGQFGARVGKTNLPHRIAYEYEIGPIPEGLVLDHLCHTREPQCADNRECRHRRCCNPTHLEPVTRRENLARGRGGDSWGYIPEFTPEPKAEQLTLSMCAACGGTEKPIYKSGKCRPCYRKWLKDPNAERPSQRTPAQRFWEKVDKRGPVPDHAPELGRCWTWTAAINPKTQYGQFFPRHGHGMDAHRFSYQLANGPIPEKHDVHHRCHLRRCVNPAHLEAVTRSENLRMRKNRRTAA